MEILPAIDLRAGQVVRLAQGDYERQTTYSSDPAAVAAELAKQGAAWIHVVDLDAARSGRLTNTQAVHAVKTAAAVRIELGGGARDTVTVEQMLDGLAERVVVGSAAIKNWPWFQSLLGRPDLVGRLALGLDARDGRLRTQGWTEAAAVTAVELASRVSGSGLGAIVYTDISRDGMLEGVNVPSTAEVIAATDVPVIASGGVGSLEDITACLGIGCAGVIVGRAWYEGRLDIREAIELGRRG